MKNQNFINKTVSPSKLTDTWKAKVLTLYPAMFPGSLNYGVVGNALNNGIWSLEITDINKEYLRAESLEVKVLGRGTVWLDTGTFQSLMQANQYVQVIEERQGRKIGCIEEAAFRMGYINREQLIEIAKPFLKSGYGEYLIDLS